MTKCRSCNSPIIEFFSLGRMPLVNSFLKKSEINKEKKYKLALAFCPNCYLVQLTEAISPKNLFTDYIYFSSTSKTIVEHSKKTAAYLTSKLKLNKNSLVVELASNDGVLLQFFKQNKIKVLGIDPANNIAEVANNKGVPTIADFFNLQLAKKLVNEKGIYADLIYGANVLAHVPEIVDFVKGVKILLKPNGTAVFESPYIGGLFENKFDTIYHEHVFYYSILALRNLFERADLQIYDFEMVKMQGGSFRIFISHPGAYKVSKKIESILNKELQTGYKKLSTYRKINKNVNVLKKELISLLKKLKKQKKTIAAYSAPAKGIILLNYFGIGTNYLEYIVDKAKEKQGLFTPGTHLLVHSLDEIGKRKPDYVLILCWNIYKEIIAMKELENFKKQKGKFIIPIPSIKVI